MIEVFQRMDGPLVCIITSSFPRYPAQGVELAGTAPDREARMGSNRGALSARTRPRIRILISFFAHSRLDSHDTLWPILCTYVCR